MTDITPPRELISQWLDEFYDPAAPSGIIPDELTIHIVTQAAQWGADQELDACVKWSIDNQHPRWAAAVQAARRPKPPSLNEIKLTSGDEIVRITPEGFHYKEQLIEDAGECHRLLVDFLRRTMPETNWKHAND